MTREESICVKLWIRYALHLPSSQYNCQQQHLPGTSHGLSRHHSGPCPEPDIAKWEHAMTGHC